jgi:hypothetical protein
MASLENARYLASQVSSRQLETFYVDDTYHVLTLDKRRDDVADRVIEFFSRCAFGARDQKRAQPSGIGSTGGGEVA